ncbi:MAG: hypothetical protein K5697_15440 [Lachnospiraceae bacterium]|nr:hypothetical protein [Lachnospiraceae bacterium]
MLFGKKDKNGKQDEGKNLKLTSAYHQPQTEEEKMRALESQLDFLRNPNHPDNLKKKAEEEKNLAGDEKNETEGAAVEASQKPVPRNEAKHPIVPNRFAPPQQTLRSARALNEAVMNARKAAEENAGEAAESKAPANANPLLGAPRVTEEEKPKDEGPQVTQAIPAPQANRQILGLKEEETAAAAPGGGHSMVAPAIQPPEGLVHPDIRRNVTEMKDSSVKPVPIGGNAKPGEDKAERSRMEQAKRSEYGTAIVEGEPAKEAEGSQLQPIPVKSLAQPAAAAPQPGEPLKNPLPTPKKHVAKEMDYDREPVQLDMHFDVVDMSGMDFFDIN